MSVLTLGALALPASADHDTREHSPNIVALGHSEHLATFFGDPSVDRHISSDIAFWGDLAFDGNYNGFRIIDISDPNNPVEDLWFDDCNGDQGDLVVWNNVLVRSWNSPAPDPLGPNGRVCDGVPVPEGFEGIHVFDITSLGSPKVVGTLELECGSHTATGVPDLENDRLIIYSNPSSGCDWIDVIEVKIPLTDPAEVNWLRGEPIIGGSMGSNRGCHDMSVILGDAMMAVCASGHAANVFSVGGARGGSLENPKYLYNIEHSDEEGTVGIGGRWHSSAFTWDGRVIVLGWEPGGGGSPECESTDPDIKKSAFFFDSASGNFLGQWTLPRGQDGVPAENCTIHNFNVVPTTNGNYILVSGNYQAGTYVTDFTDPANPVDVAYSDPPPIDPLDLGGPWSSYWYNGYIYESDITKGLNVFSLNEPELLGNPVTLPFLNPQTQMFTIAPPVRCGGVVATHVGTSGDDVIVGTANADVVAALGGNDRIVTGGGNDLICAGSGDDLVRAGAGGDRVRGQAGDDVLRGQRGNDRLSGGPDDDLCAGGPGRDRGNRSCETRRGIP